MLPKNSFLSMLVKWWNIAVRKLRRKLGVHSFVEISSNLTNLLTTDIIGDHIRGALGYRPDLWEMIRIHKKTAHIFDIYWQGISHHWFEDNALQRQRFILVSAKGNIFVGQRQRQRKALLSNPWITLYVAIISRVHWALLRINNHVASPKLLLYQYNI